MRSIIPNGVVCKIENSEMKLQGNESKDSNLDDSSRFDESELPKPENVGIFEWDLRAER